MLSMTEVNWLRYLRATPEPTPTLTDLLDCTSQRPTYPDDASCPVLTRMLREFPQPTGLTDAEVSAHLAASLGGAGFCEDGDLCG